MTLGLMFWILMLLWLVLGLYWRWPRGPVSGPGVIMPVAGDLLLFILLLLLGWHAFGAPIHG